MKQLSIRNKISLSFGLIISIVMVINTIIHIQEIKRDYLEALEWRSQALAQLIFRDIKLIKKYTPTAMKDPLLVFQTLSQSCRQLFFLNHESTITHCAVINPEGFIKAHNRSILVDQPVSPVIQSHIQDSHTVTVLDGDSYHTLVPIVEQVDERDSFLGMIDIGIPKEVVAVKIKRLIKESTGLLSLFLVITFFCVSFLLYAAVGKPLSKLMQVANEIIKGNYGARAQLTTHDEIGRTGKAFDKMTGTLIDTIQQRDQHIRSVDKLTQDLEKRVADRTAELVHAKEKAEAANKAKSIFLANMSHELRTPLNAILGYSRLMQKDILSPAEHQEYIITINRNGEHLLTLINDVLEISKIEAGQLTLESSTFDLQALFCDLEKAFDAGISAKGLYFRIIGLDTVPRYVTGDENKLRQVLVNIIGNGVKFTEDGGITVRVTARDEAAGVIRLCVEVQDTGIGIAEEEQEKVFAYLEQTTGGRANKSGTGLGLAISRDYVHLMGGDITVTSKEGEGSSFRFEIDIQKGEKTDLKVRGSRQHVIGLQPGQKVPRILVAEDKEDSRILLVKILKTAGFLVEEAVNGEDAVKIFTRWRPDFIWMDIRMPVMDGLEATRHIKKHETGQATIVTALTAHVLAEEKERILAAGCDDLVRKPFREQEIFEVMAKHLGLKYVYEDEPVERDAGVKPKSQVTPQQLASLPAEIRNRLYQAAVELNEGRSLEVIEQIKQYDSDLAGTLKTIVNNLEFPLLLKLLQGVQTKT